MTRVFVAGMLTLALTGCGTVGNFLPGRETPHAFLFDQNPPERIRPYGGVKIAANSIRYSHDVALTFTWPFRLTDLVMSAIGDTLTLPITLPIAFGYAVHDSFTDYYFPKKQPETAKEPDTSDPKPPAAP